MGVPRIPPAGEGLSGEHPLARANRWWERTKRVLIAAAAAVVSVNIWTGAPLLALWVGSQVAPSEGASMGAIVVVLVVLVCLVAMLAFLLARLNAAYDRLSGRDQTKRVAPWLRSMRAERAQFERRRRRLTPVERFAMVSVVVAVLALEVWFFVFAHYALPGA